MGHFLNIIFFGIACLNYVAWGLLLNELWRFMKDNCKNIFAALNCFKYSQIGCLNHFNLNYIKLTL